MTSKTKTIMVMQGLAFLVYWPITIHLIYSANHPPLSVMVAAAAVSFVLAVLAVTANLYRDRCYQAPVTKSLYNSIQFFTTITALTVINLSGGICRVLRMPPEERGTYFYPIYVILAMIGISVLMLGWSLFRWWLSRRRAA